MKYLFLAFLFLWAPLFGSAEAIKGEADENTPVMFTDMKEQLPVVPSEPWVVPDFSGQDKSLGYTTTVFAVPKGMEDRVEFWTDIYSKFTTDQGVLHDSLYLHLVYATVDFSEIAANKDLTDRERQKARKKKLEDAKKEVRDRLTRLEKVNSPEGLDDEDQRYWEMFEKITDKHKFREAARKGRLRFQLGQRDRFIKGIFYSGRYLKQMEKIFREEGMPVELTRLPFVESSFNINARSRVGASGIWQFMRSAGRRYLKMNTSADERNDPISATFAAAKMLRFNYNMLGAWPLAVTAYNHGPSGMARMTRAFKTNDIVELIEKRRGRFGFASANFFASFLAAVEVEMHADKYFGKVLREKEQLSEQVVLTKPLPMTVLIEWFNGDVEKAKIYNPHLRTFLWSGRNHVREKNFVRIPPEKMQMAQEYLKNAKGLASAESDEKDAQVYRIVQGDTLDTIAQQFGVRTAVLIEVNGIDDPRRLRVGQKLIIPAK